MPVQLTACSALSSDHLQVLIDTRCRSSFLNLPDRPDFTRTDLCKFHACLESDTSFNPESADEATIDTRVRNSSSAIRGAFEVSAPSEIYKLIEKVVKAPISLEWKTVASESGMEFFTSQRPESAVILKQKEGNIKEKDEE